MVAGLTKEHTCAPTHDQQEGSRAQWVQSAGCRGQLPARPRTTSKKGRVRSVLLTSALYARGANAMS